MSQESVFHNQLSSTYPVLEHSLGDKWSGWSNWSYQEDPRQDFQKTSNVQAIFEVMKHDPPIRFLFMPGGQDASKTVGALMWQIAALNSDAILKAWKTGKQPLRAFNCSQTGQKADDTVFSIFKDIMVSYGMWKENSWLQRKMVYTFENGNEAYFGGPDDFEKAKGKRFNIAYFDEMTSIDIEVFRQITQRIFNKVLTSWNPDTEGWFEDEFLPELKKNQDVRRNWMVMRLNYLGNQKTHPEVVIELEAMKEANPDRYKVYGLGETGRIDQQVYGYWEEANLPQEATLVARGIDFGYNDPSVVIDGYVYGQWWHLDERLYQSHLNDEDLAEWINQHCHRAKMIPLVCDAKKPQAIETLRRWGLPAWPSTCQGNNQKIPSIELLQSKNIRYTPRSINLAREAKRYKYAISKKGTIDYTKIADRQEDHALDASRYLIYKFQNYVSKPNLESTGGHTTFRRKVWFGVTDKQEDTYGRIRW